MSKGEVWVEVIELAIPNVGITRVFMTEQGIEGSFDFCGANLSLHPGPGLTAREQWKWVVRAIDETLLIQAIIEMREALRCFLAGTKNTTASILRPWVAGYLARYRACINASKEWRSMVESRGVEIEWLPKIPEISDEDVVNIYRGKGKWENYSDCAIRLRNIYCSALRNIEAHLEVDLNRKTAQELLLMCNW